MGGKIRARLFVPHATLEAGASVTPDDAQARYLLATLRMQDGEAVALFNGRDGEWEAHAALKSRKSLELRAVSRRAAQKGVPDIRLLFAPVKNEKVDFLVKRAVELGIRAAQPVITRYTMVSRVNTERLRANAVEAAEQCGRMDVPEIVEPKPLERVLSEWDAGRTLLFCDEEGQGAPIRSLLPSLPKGAYGVLIGPEGGFSPDERDMLRRLPFVRAVSLGPRILRAETAALAALANVQAWLGDWDETPNFEGSHA